MPNDQPHPPEPDHESLALVDELDGHEFENLVEQLLVRMGFHIEGRQAAADGGIDMIATKGEAIVGGKFIIQCKRYSGSVGNAVIRDLFGVVHSEAANKGVLITNSTFSKQARDFADGKPIELIDGAKLQELLLKHGLLKTATLNNELRLSPGVQILYSQLVGPLKRIIDESRRVADGLVFLPHENVDLNRYNRLVQRHMGQVFGFLGTLPSFAEPLMAAMNEYDPTPEAMSALRMHVKEILAMARALLKIQKEAQSVVPPAQFSTAHKSYIRIGPAFLDRLWPFAAVIEDLVEGRTSEREYNLHLDMNIPEIDEMNAELRRIQNVRARPNTRLTGGCVSALAIGCGLLAVVFGFSAMNQGAGQYDGHTDNFCAGMIVLIGFVFIFAGVVPLILMFLSKRE